MIDSHTDTDSIYYTIIGVEYSCPNIWIMSMSNVRSVLVEMGIDGKLMEMDENG